MTRAAPPQPTILPSGLAVHVYNHAGCRGVRVSGRPLASDGARAMRGREHVRY